MNVKKRGLGRGLDALLGNAKLLENPVMAGFFCAWAGNAVVL